MGNQIMTPKLAPKFDGNTFSPGSNHELGLKAEPLVPVRG